MLYTRARQAGVMFIRYEESDPPRVSQTPAGKLEVTTRDPILGREVLLEPDALVLAAAVIPTPNKELFDLFKVPVNADGFLNEAHAQASARGLCLGRHFPGRPGPLSQAVWTNPRAQARACRIPGRHGPVPGPHHGGRGGG